MPTDDDRTRLRALIKWGQRRHLEELADGLLHCNTPEFYRVNPSMQFGDRNESCGYSYRAGRDTAPPKLVIAGEEAEGFVALTVARGDGKEYYLHCWTALLIPADSQELDSMRVDLLRMREELGPSYAVLSGGRIRSFLERVQSADKVRPICDLVEYSSDPNRWGPMCKSVGFRHQREFRFLVGECDTNTLRPKRLAVRDLRDIVSVEPVLEVKHKGETILKLTKDGIA